MIALLVALACAPPPEYQAGIEPAALAWAGEGGRVRSCSTFGSCDVVTASGCEVRVSCHWDELGERVQCERVEATCPGGAR